MLKKLIDENSHYADWTTRTDIRASIDTGVLELLYYNGYPISEKDEDVSKKVLEQAVSYNQSGDFEYAV